jgi:SNF2 family DNA or RNA helicase
LLIDINDLDDDFVKEMESDKQFLESLLYEREDIDIDPKLDVFVEKLHILMKEQPERKIVVFSQYTATIDYLETKLKNKFRTIKVT